MQEKPKLSGNYWGLQVRVDDVENIMLSDEEQKIENFVQGGLQEKIKSPLPDGWEKVEREEKTGYRLFINVKDKGDAEKIKLWFEHWEPEE